MKKKINVLFAILPSFFFLSIINAKAQQTSTYYLDFDGDGYGNPVVSQTSATQPADYVSNNLDCNDNNRNIHPGATEVCNGIDDDCDGLIDEKMPEGLKLFMPFNGNANDASGNNHDGIIYNAILTTDRFGNANTAFYFNGTNARIEIADHTDFHLSNFTIAAWVNVNPASQSIISKSLGTGFFNSYTMGYDNNSLASALSDGNSSPVYYSGTAMPNGWFHYALTFDDQNNTLKFYVNGLQVGSATTPIVIGYDNNALTIGCEYQYGIPAYLTLGKIDEVMIFNQCLLISQINTIYQNVGSTIAPVSEICNGIDDDCDGLIDEGFTKTVYYTDGDGDGFGDANDNGVSSCEPISGKVTNNTDCDDIKATVHPGATEVCNGIDDDCDGLVDERLPGRAILYMPFDGNANDASGNEHNGIVYNATLTADRLGNPNSAYSFNGTNSRIEIQDHTDFHLTDFTISLWANINPVSQSLVSKSFGTGFFNSYTIGFDNNTLASALSDGNTSPVYYASPPYIPTNWFFYTITFDDQNNTIKFYVNNTEVSSSNVPFTLGYDNSIITIGCEYQYGNIAYPTLGKLDEVMIFDHALTASEINLLYQNDGSSISTTTEICNGIDDDCDGLIDEGFTKVIYYTDGDGDGFGNANDTGVSSCTPISGKVTNNTDCDDTKPSVHPEATEVCNGIDDDCDGLIDEDVKLIFYRDADGDGYGSSVVTTQSCSAPSGYVSNNTDCDDAKANVHPGATEVCNGIDDDCDGMIDEGVKITFYRDADGDGYGNSVVTTQACSPSDGYVSNSTDCNDNDASVHEGNGGICSCSLTASCATNTPDNNLYYGYTGDQSSTLTVKPSGGVAPYKIEITMSRPLLCNQINDAGDEIWAGGSGGATINNSCPANPNLATVAPLSSKSIFSGSYTVTVTLMEDADIIATITDANGCKITCSTHIHAEDVRCFAGKSNVTKVTLCHRTGSQKNPCVTMCVDEDAVNEHLAHGDFLGKCTSDCMPPSLARSISSTSTSSSIFSTEKLKVKILPNPISGNDEFKLIAEGGTNEMINIRAINEYGQVLHRTKGSANATYKFGRQFRSGIYIVQVTQGQTVQTFKVVKG